MNMKKTMAAIAAGAVAVSAMATTVSAEDANTLWGNKTVTFNLVQNVKETTGYKGTIVSTIDRLTLAAGTLDIEISDLDNDDVVTVSGYYIDDNTPIRTMVFTKNPDDSRFTPAGAARVTVADAANNGVGKVSIPVLSSTYDKDFTIDIGTSGSAQMYLNIVVEKSVGMTVVRGVGDTRSTTPYYETSKKVREALDAGNVKIALDDNTSRYSSDPTEAGITAPLPTSADGWDKTESEKNYPYYTYASTLLGGAIEQRAHGYSGNVLGCVFKTGTAKNKITAADINTATEEHIPAYYVSNIINDAINSYGNVTFTLNTYKGKLEDNSDPADTFDKNWWQLDKGDVSGLFDDTTYWINNWQDMSLFNSALIVNSNLTFSLSDAQAMKWTRDSLTFDWDDIQAAALNPNVLTNYINSMVLRTGQEWYWESLVVVFEEGVAEDVTAGAGDEANDNQIPDDDEGDIDFGDDDEDEGDEDWGDEDEGDEDEGDEDEDEGDEDEGDVDNAGDVESPKTGNPAVALAVIPVALAAAAVVAKKRG